MQSPGRGVQGRLGCAALVVWVLAGATATAQRPAGSPLPLVKEGATRKLSAHVYTILDDDVPTVPNVGIVVGTRGTLVIDTGLGPRNGEAVLREVAKVSKNAEVYLVATHFHPEHAGGSSAFPAAKFLVSDAQQRDLDELGLKQVAAFASRSAIEAELLKGVQFHNSDIRFEREYTLDLGGVRARILSLGPTHTRGDTIVMVEEDRVLFAGDIVLRNRFLSFGQYSSAPAWVNILKELAAFRAPVVVPSHGALADASVIEDQRTFLEDLQTRVRELKSAGRSAEEAGQVLTPEFTARYPAWRFPERIAVAARSIFAELR